MCVLDACVCMELSRYSEKTFAEYKEVLVNLIYVYWYQSLKYIVMVTKGGNVYQFYHYHQYIQAKLNGQYRETVEKEEAFEALHQVEVKRSSAAFLNLPIIKVCY